MQKFISYEIREIDKYGDVIDTTFCEDGRGAMARCNKHWQQYTSGGHFDGESVAAVYERVTKWGDDDRGVCDQDYETIATVGDKAALELGGW